MVCSGVGAIFQIPAASAISSSSFSASKYSTAISRAAIDRLVRGVEAEQSFADRNELLEASALRDDRPSGCQVAHSAIAEPSRARPHVNVLGDGEFSARSAYVAAVLIYVERHRHYRRDAESAGNCAVVVGSRGQVGRDFDGLSRTACDLERFAEIYMLRPVVGLAADFHVVAEVLPSTDRRICNRLGGSDPGTPFIEIHRRPRYMPIETGGWEQAIGRANIVAIRKKQFVSCGKTHRGGNLARDFELHNTRIGFEINQAAVLLMLLTRFDRAAEIDDRVGIAEQFHASFARHADILVASRIEE